MAYSYDRRARTQGVHWNKLSPKDRAQVFDSAPRSVLRKIEALLPEVSAFRTVRELKDSMVNHGYLPTVRDAKLKALFETAGVPYDGNPFVAPKKTPRAKKPLIRVFVEEVADSDAFEEGEYSDGTPKLSVNSQFYFSLGADEEVPSDVLNALYNLPTSQGRGRGFNWSFGDHSEENWSSRAPFNSKDEVLFSGSWALDRKGNVTFDEGSRKMPLAALANPGHAAVVDAAKKFAEALAKKLQSQHPDYKFSRPKFIKAKSPTVSR
jgi:hypothetical protein